MKADLTIRIFITAATFAFGYYFAHEKFGIIGGIACLVTILMVWRKPLKTNGIINTG